MLNRITLMGNIGRDPEFKVTKQGKQITTFFLTTKYSWKDETGEWHSHTDWHQVTVFRESTVKWLKDLLKKGDSVYIEGKLTYQTWTDKYNQPRITPHVVVRGSEGKVQYVGKFQHIRPTLLNPQNKNTQNETAIEKESLSEASPSLQASPSPQPTTQTLPLIQPEKEKIQ